MRADLRALIEEAKRLEALAMGVYTQFAATFSARPEFDKFWMSMARHEAGHVGALTLLQTLLEQSGIEVDLLDAPRVVARSAEALESLRAEANDLRDLDRAFELAVDIESLELEDLVLDLIHLLADRAAREQAEQLLLHDLSDLSLMIEKHCTSDHVLVKADALVDSRVDSAARQPLVCARQV